jgi:transposase
MREPQEIEDEEHEQVWERVAAVDVAKASGMVCIRVPHPSRPGRRVSKVWEVVPPRLRSSSLGSGWLAWG